jgi:uncharacterized membrane protein YoaK (UPF0700 family)
MALDAREPPVPRRRIALLLAGSAGYLDAIGYLHLRIFTANMTGNTVLLGIATGQGQWAQDSRVALAIASFVCGAAAGAVVLSRRRRLGGVLGAEAALLLGALGSWVVFSGRAEVIDPAEVISLIVLLSAAMGVQNAAVRRVGEQRVATTYITGILTNLAIDAVTALVARLERPASRAAAELAAPLPLLAGLWLAYVGGALAGGFADLEWRFYAVLVPVAVLVTLVAWDVSRPLRTSAG